MSSTHPYLPYLETSIISTSYAINTITFNNDGNFILIGGISKIPTLYNPHSNKLIHKYINGHGYDILDIKMYEDRWIFYFYFC